MSEREPFVGEERVDPYRRYVCTAVESDPERSIVDYDTFDGRGEKVGSGWGEWEVWLNLPAAPLHTGEGLDGLRERAVRVLATRKAMEEASDRVDCAAGWDQEAQNDYVRNRDAFHRGVSNMGLAAAEFFASDAVNAAASPSLENVGRPSFDMDAAPLHENILGMSPDGEWMNVYWDGDDERWMSYFDSPWPVVAWMRFPKVAPPLSDVKGGAQ